jgi:Fic/DOC family
MRSKICHETKIIEDFLIGLPRRSDLPPALLGRLHQATAQLADLRSQLLATSVDTATLARKILACPANDIACLHHPLAAEAIARQNTAIQYDPKKSLREWHAFEHVIARSKISPEMPVSVSLFKALGPSLGIANPRFRDMNNGWMNADSEGWRTRLPVGQPAKQRLMDIDTIVRDLDQPHELFTATRLLVLFLNCHPFLDGNGRSARILFNLALNKGTPETAIYIPLNEFIYRSDGGFQIRLLLAIRKGEWEPIFTYACDMISIVHEFCRPHTAA